MFHQLLSVIHNSPTVRFIVVASLTIASVYIVMLFLENSNVREFTKERLRFDSERISILTSVSVGWLVSWLLPYYV